MRFFRSSSSVAGTCTGSSSNAGTLASWLMPVAPIAICPAAIGVVSRPVIDSPTYNAHDAGEDAGALPTLPPASDLYGTPATCTTALIA